MKNYEKPAFSQMNSLAEGVYAASGTSGEGGGAQYTVEVHPTHTENHDIPAGSWRFDITGTHAGSEKWGIQTVTIDFDVPVTVDYCKADSYSGDATTRLTLTYSKGKTNGSIQFGELRVKATTQPNVMSASISEG